MPWIAFQQGPDVVSGFGQTSAACWFRPDDPTRYDIPQLTDIAVLAARGSGALYEGRMYVCGQYTDNVMIDEHMRLHRLGIDAPITKPTLASGGGGPISGMVGVHLGYISFYDEITGERSSLSASSASFNNAGANAITWTNIPTTAPNPRVTHVELWRSVDGGAIRFVGRRTIGVSTATEQIATLALGEVAPDFFERFPPCKINAVYHDRHVMAGNREAPDTLYLSAMFFPERFEGLTFKTRNGEPIVGLVNVRDMLLVLCPESSYILQGYSEEDAVFSMSEPELGALGHHGIKLAHGNAIIPNSKSIYLFNGSWHNIMKDGMDEWRQAYDEAPEAFEQGFGIYDPVADVYKFGMFGAVSAENNAFSDIYNPTGLNTGTLYYVADMRPTVPQIEGTFAPPNWSFDFRNREDLCAAVLAVPGWTRPQVVTGSVDGFLRIENQGFGDDDEDTYGNRFTIITKGYNMDDPGGGPEDGKTLRRLWSYVESETSDWLFKAIGGDEHAYLSMVNEDGLFGFEDDVDGSLASYNDGSLEGPYTPKTVHIHPVEKVSGRAFFFMVSVPSPSAVVFRGLGGTYGPGPITRPPLILGVIE